MEEHREPLVIEGVHIEFSPPTVLASEVYDVEIQQGELKVTASGAEVYRLDLSEAPSVHIRSENGNCKLYISTMTTQCTLLASSEQQANAWLEYIHQEIMLAARPSNGTKTELGSRFVSYLRSLHQALPDEVEQDSNESSEVPGLPPASKSLLMPPPMNIVILVVGTRGDVQPFIYLGQGLLQHGHRVRLATHADYRRDVLDGKLEYYPLAGDPKKLSEYMVKTAGRLMPDLLNSEERLELPEKMAMLRDICFSCFPACSAPDPEDPDQKSFLADAIISNPVSYGHIHCAEALSIPLHIMFPQPWYPTKEFPHPLSNMGFHSNWSMKNYYSYRMIDEFMWLGLGSMINTFRQSVLHLPPIRLGERGDQMLNDNKVPISHTWSPSFVPRCKDWPSHVDVVGEYRNHEQGGSKEFTPPQALDDFLQSGDRPIYIGSTLNYYHN